MEYQAKYENLKRKLKILLYEQETFQKDLEKSQHKLLRVSRDKSFLLDRLLLYEQISDDSSSDTDATLSSECETDLPTKKKNTSTVKIEAEGNTTKLEETPVSTPPIKAESNIEENNTKMPTDEVEVKMEGPSVDSRDIKKTITADTDESWCDVDT